MTFDLDMIKKVYELYPERVAKAREVVGKPLTLSEKILIPTFGKVVHRNLMKEEILM